MSDVSKELRKHLVELGRKGGSVSSEAKKAAARLNGERAREALKAKRDAAKLALK